jgi:GT2 family glycosyltransferase
VHLSVVVPVKDGATKLALQLAALAAQQFDGEWEIVVADNGSVEDTAAAAKDLSIRWVDASARPGAAAARNIGAAHASGEALAFCDADDIVEPGWLAALAAALQTADLAAGAFDFHRLNPASGENGAVHASLEQQFRFLPAGLGANLAISAATFHQLGGFAEDLPAGEDVDLCWRAQQSGARFAYAPDAVVAKRERSSAKGLAQQAFGYGRSDVALFVKHRGAGMPRALPLAVKTWAWLLLHALGAIRNPRIRALWIRSAALRAGRLVGSIQQRVFYP